MGLQLSSVPEQQCFRQDIDDEFDIAQSAILDTGSTFSAVANKELVAGVHNSDDMTQMNAMQVQESSTRRDTNDSLIG